MCEVSTSDIRNGPAGDQDKAVRGPLIEADSKICEKKHTKNENNNSFTYFIEFSCRLSVGVADIITEYISIQPTPRICPLSSNRCDID